MVTQLLQLVEELLAGAAIVRRVAAFWGPIVPAPALLGPFLAVGSILALALLSGIAVGSVTTLIITLIALYLIITEVFGVAIEIDVLGRA